MKTRRGWCGSCYSSVCTFLRTVARQLRSQEASHLDIGGPSQRRANATIGQLRENEVLLEIPEWPAEEKVGFIDGATPTLFVGRIDRETDKAMQVVDSAAARPLMTLAHRIQHPEDDSDGDRREWLDTRLQDLRDEFENRDDVTGFPEEWIPKSQDLHTIRRAD